MRVGLSSGQMMNEPNSGPGPEHRSEGPEHRYPDTKGRDTDPKGRNTDPKDLVPDDRTQDKSAGQTLRKTANTQGYYYNG